MSANNELTTTALTGPVQIIRMPQAEMENLAAKAGKTGMFGKRTLDEAHLLMAAAESEGKHPLQGLREYDIIQGLIAKKAQAMQADFQKAGGRLQWLERSTDAAEAEFYHPAGGTLRVRWTMEDAARAGLANKDNWRKHPRQMLGNRVISEGVRAILPGVSLGMYTDEEVNDFDTSAPRHAASPQGPRAIAPQDTPQKAIESAPEAKSEPGPVNKARINEAMGKFADEARRLGQDVDSDTKPGQASRSKLVALLEKVYAHIEFSVDSSSLNEGDWNDASQALPAYVQSLAPAVTETTEVDEGEDPFAETPDAQPSLPRKGHTIPAGTIPGTERFAATPATDTRGTVIGAGLL